MTLTWRPMTAELRTVQLQTYRLDRILRDWAGTPYVEGMQGEGQGVDCVRFVYAVLDELHGFERKDPWTLPQDSAMHNREGAFRTMRGICERYPHERVMDGTLEPTDVIVTGPKGGGPGHALIVGPRRWELWHATLTDVHRTGKGFLDNPENELFRIYRMTSKEQWPCGR